MNILILGGGGREHALAWAIKQNPKCGRLIVAPGNAGIENIAECAVLDIMDGAEVLRFAQENTIDFVVIGPEAPLDAGVADRLRAGGVLVFGPSQAAARLESSKAFTKEICAAVDAPTAAYQRFHDVAAARDYARTRPLPVVVKADGLAAGKGVVVAETYAQAKSAINDMLQSDFGGEKPEIIIEDFLCGEEASFFVLSDGKTLLPIGSAQDHKRAFDGDQGPNTGGMGAYSPAPVMDDSVVEKAMSQIIRPTMVEMARRGTPFQGVLFAGFMIDAGQPKLVEYNVRFGDPECQALMMRLGGQILDLLLDCANATLDQASVSFANDHAMTVVYAANGYPGAYGKGSVVQGLDALVQNSKNMVFHAGTSRTKGAITVSGGRVLSVTARADNLQDAQRQCYEMLAAIEWPGGFYRTDIGWRVLT